MHLKKHDTITDTPSIMIYVSKIKNRITFKIKPGSYLELLTPETMSFLGSTKTTMDKNKKCANVPNLEIN